jgi:hypothetical protein
MRTARSRRGQRPAAYLRFQTYLDLGRTLESSTGSPAGAVPLALLAVSWLYYVKGRNDTACFAIVDADWQVIPTAFEG